MELPHYPPFPIFESSKLVVFINECIHIFNCYNYLNDFLNEVKRMLFILNNSLSWNMSNESKISFLKKLNVDIFRIFVCFCKFLPNEYCLNLERDMLEVLICKIKPTHLISSHEFIDYYDKTILIFHEMLEFKIETFVNSKQMCLINEIKGMYKLLALIIEMEFYSDKIKEFENNSLLIPVKNIFITFFGSLINDRIKSL